MSDPIFNRRHYEFIASLLSASQLAAHTDQSVDFSEDRFVAWVAGQRLQRKRLIDGFCAKFYIDNPKSFNEERFRRACK